MALSAQKALLDELLGKNRNACDGENMSGPHWSDDDMCKYFLCGFCPHDLFVNTKTDLGVCDKVHDERMRTAYAKSHRYGKMGYEYEFVRFLSELLDDVEKRIRRGHERLAVNKCVNNPDPDTAVEKKVKINALTKRINDLIKQAEQLGTEGKVDQAQGVLKLCEQLKYERSMIEGDPRPGVTQTKELEVCEICGAFRIKDDAPQRVEEHLLGKMHLGYSKIRDYLRQYSERKLEFLRLGARTQPSNTPPDREQRRSRDKSVERSPQRNAPRPNNSNSSSHNRHHSGSSRSRSKHDHYRDDHHHHKHHHHRRSRSRSRSRKASDRQSRSDHSRSTKRNISPFSAARRLPEGAEDY